MLSPKKATRKKAHKKAKIKGWRKGNTHIIEEKERPYANAKNIRVKRKPKGTASAGTFVYFQKLNGVLQGYFDTINDLDALRKERNRLALKYHSDITGGDDEIMKEINAEYERKRDEILNKSNLSKADQDNEIEIDEAIKAAFEAIKHLPNIKIEIIGKWIWVSGNTFPVHTEIKKAGFEFMKKWINGKLEPFWVYKGVPSSSRGGMSMEEIREKYKAFEPKISERKKLKGIPRSNKKRFGAALRKLVKAVNKRRAIN
jgi:hypothetical protein